MEVLIVSKAIDEIVDDIYQSITSKVITPKTEKFLIHWLSDEVKTESDREIFKILAKSGILPYRGNTGNLFRGCRSLIDDKVESYSFSVVEASRFAGEGGYIISVDTHRYNFYSFDLSGYFGILLNDIMDGTSDNFYFEEFVSMFEDRSGEDEVLLITDLDHSVVLTTYKIGSEV